MPEVYEGPVDTKDRVSLGHADLLDIMSKSLSWLLARFITPARASLEFR